MQRPQTHTHTHNRHTRPPGAAQAEKAIAFAGIVRCEGEEYKRFSRPQAGRGGPASGGASAGTRASKGKESLGAKRCAFLGSKRLKLQFPQGVLGKQQGRGPPPCAWGGPGVACYAEGGADGPPPPTHREHMQHTAGERGETGNEMQQGSRRFPVCVQWQSPKQLRRASTLGGGGRTFVSGQAPKCGCQRRMQSCHPSKVAQRYRGKKGGGQGAALAPRPPATSRASRSRRPGSVKERPGHRPPRRQGKRESDRNSPVNLRL